MDPRRRELEEKVARLRQQEHDARSQRRGRRFERVDAELTALRQALEHAERELRKLRSSRGR